MSLYNSRNNWVIGSLATMLYAISAASNAQENSDPVQLTEEKRQELLQNYPNPAWGSVNTFADQLIQLEDNLYTYANQGGSRTFFLVTRDGVIVGDPIDTDTAANLYEHIRRVTDKPIKYLIYSHNHWDHIEGGQIFKDAGAQVIAHEKCQVRFGQRPHPAVVPADIVFGGNYTVELGGERVDLLYYGKNHSDCLVFPLLKNGKYLFVVDIIGPGAIPLGPFVDNDVIGSIQTLEQLERLPIEGIISGHGAPLAAKSALEERRLYLVALMQVVEDELSGGYRADFYERVEKRMEPFSYMRGWNSPLEFGGFRQNVTAMLFYVGIGQ